MLESGEEWLFVINSWDGNGLFFKRFLMASLCASKKAFSKFFFELEGTLIPKYMSWELFYMTLLTWSYAVLNASLISSDWTESSPFLDDVLASVIWI